MDLFPPPVTWMPPNCVFEVDDLIQDWTWHEPFDLVFIRHLIGSFDKKGWDTLYKHCYELVPPTGPASNTETDALLETWSPVAGLSRSNSMFKSGVTMNLSRKTARLPNGETLSLDVENELIAHWQSRAPCDLASRKPDL